MGLNAGIRICICSRVLTVSIGKLTQCTMRAELAIETASRAGSGHDVGSFFLSCEPPAKTSECRMPT